MKDKITHGEKYGRAVKIKTQEEADAYLEECVQHHMRLTGKSREECIAIEKQNIGYWAGYYDKETFARVTKLYRTGHPVFGDDDSIWNNLGTAYEAGALDGAKDLAKS